MRDQCPKRKGEEDRKHNRVSPSPYVPDENGSTPFPAWKRIDVVQDALAPKDIGRAAGEGGVITEEEYGAKLANCWRSWLSRDYQSNRAFSIEGNQHHRFVSPPLRLCSGAAFRAHAGSPFKPSLLFEDEGAREREPDHHTS